MPLPALYRVVDWFPDGNHLLLESGDLWKVSTWDFSMRKLWSGHAWGAALSPEGSHIAFVTDGEVWLMGADGEEPRKILASNGQEQQFSAAWSPTGQRIAYLRAHQSTLEKAEATIETCDLTGGARTVVLSDPDLLNDDGAVGIAWLPDGRIIYSKKSSERESDLWAIAAEPASGKRTGDPTRLGGWKNFAALDPQASADGKRLIAGREHTQTGIYIGDLAIGNAGFTPRRFNHDDWYDYVSAWTRDSKAVVFSSKRNGRWAIFEQELDSPSLETLIAGPESYIRPRLSAQGNLLYTARSATSTTNYRLMSTPEHGGARSTLMIGLYDYACGSLPSSSCVLSELKDGQLIFSYLDPVKGRGQEIARVAGYQTRDPRWDLSPDGTRIAIVDPAEGKGEVRIVSVADQKVSVLPVRDWKWLFLSIITWAADGKTLFAQAQNSFSVVLISIDTNGNPRVLQEMPAGSGWIGVIVPSPDGRSLAITKRSYTEDVMLLENF